MENNNLKVFVQYRYYESMGCFDVYKCLYKEKSGKNITPTNDVHYALFEFGLDWYTLTPEYLEPDSSFRDDVEVYIVDEDGSCDGIDYNNNNAKIVRNEIARLEKDFIKKHDLISVDDLWKSLRTKFETESEEIKKDCVYVENYITRIISKSEEKVFDEVFKVNNCKHQIMYQEQERFGGLKVVEYFANNRIIGYKLLGGKL